MGDYWECGNCFWQGAQPDNLAVCPTCGSHALRYVADLPPSQGCDTIGSSGTATTVTDTKGDVTNGKR